MYLIKNGKLNLSDLIEIVLLFFTGFFGLSTFAKVLLDRLGFYLIEIFLIPILIYYFCNKSINFNKKLLFRASDIFLLFLLITSILIGIVSTGEIFDVLTCIRPYIYLLIIIKYIRDNNVEINIKKLYILAFSCVLGDLIYILNYSSGLVNNGYQHINIYAISLIIAISLLSKRSLFSMANVLFAMAVSVMSGYRINIFVSLITIGSGLVFLILSSPKEINKLKYIIICILSIVVLCWIVNNFSLVSDFLEKTLNLSKKTVERSLGRTGDLINNELGAGDRSRINLFKRPFKQFWSQILPRGPIGKINILYFGTYTDVPIIFLYDLYGSIISWIMVILYAVFFIKKSVYIIKNYRIVSEYSFLFTILFPVILFSFIINGTFFSFVNISIMFALAIGGCVNN